MKLINRIFGASIILASAFLFAFAFVHSAEAQTTWGTMDMGHGWERHSFSDGTTGYSMPMGDGWRRHSFSDGTTGYSMPLYDHQTAPRYGSGLKLRQWQPRTYRWSK